MKDFVNVLCTEGTDEPDERRTKQLKRGLVERVEETITPMQLSDKARMREGCMPKCIVVHGAPGSRKIMFSWESQKEILTTSMLGNEAIVRTVDLRLSCISPHDTNVLGYCISLSRCQWELELCFLQDKHIDTMKEAISS